MRALAVRTTGFLAFCMLAVLSVGPGQANYIPPVDAERYLLLADSWTINSTTSLKIDRNGKKYEWNIDMFRLADRIDSNTICTGSYRRVMSEYLTGLRTRKADLPLLVELVSLKTGGQLVVSGLWSFDYKTNWEKAIQRGSRLLDMSAESIRKLGSAAGYNRKVKQISARNWQKMLDRNDEVTELPHD